jgi:hypothetical protein
VTGLPADVRCVRLAVFRGNKKLGASESVRGEVGAARVKQRATQHNGVFGGVQGNARRTGARTCLDCYGAAPRDP